MPRPFYVGDRVYFRGQNPLLGDSRHGTIQQNHLGSSGFYDVRIDATGEVYLLAEWDLALVAGTSAPAPFSVALAREVGGSQAT